MVVILYNVQPLHLATKINVTPDDIEMAIYSLKWKGGAGADNLFPFVIKICVVAFVWPIWLLYQKTFGMARISNTLKLSRVQCTKKAIKMTLQTTNQFGCLKHFRNCSQK